jgi:energy-converting hydrogenase Eha subunit B
LFNQPVFLSTPVSAEELSGGYVMETQYGIIVNYSLESAGNIDVYVITTSEGDFISANVIYTGNDECEQLRLTRYPQKIV